MNIEEKLTVLNEKVWALLSGMDYEVEPKKRFTSVYRKEKQSLVSRLLKLQTPSFIYECVMDPDPDQPDSCTLSGMVDKDMESLKDIATRISTVCSIKVNLTHGNEIITFNTDGEIEKTTTVC